VKRGGRSHVVGERHILPFVSAGIFLGAAWTNSAERSRLVLAGNDPVDARNRRSVGEMGDQEKEGAPLSYPTVLQSLTKRQRERPLCGRENVCRWV